MTVTETRALPAWLHELAESAGLAQSITVLSFALVLGTPLWRSLAGDAGYATMLAGLCALAATSLRARRAAIEWRGVVPVSLIAFVAWAVASTIWSTHPFDTAMRLLPLLAVGLLGLYIALARDTIQIVRGLGNVLRVLLGASLALEVISGILLDAPLAGIGIQGSIAFGGPIQGIFGSRALLGFISLLALFTFAIEWRTRSLRRSQTIVSFGLVAICLLFAGSPVTLMAGVIVALAAGALFALRHTGPTPRWRWHVGLVAAGLAALALAWVFRDWVVAALNSLNELSLRVEVWQEMSRYLFNNPWQGWGYSGSWWEGAPYSWVQRATEPSLTNGMNGFFDVYFQLGVIGLVVFLVAFGTALVRSWILAANRRSVIYVWPALVMVLLLVISLADSFVLTGAGWMLFVLAATKASRELSWREAWDSRTGAELPSRAGR